jgi:hypothetical protein
MQFDTTMLPMYTCPKTAPDVPKILCQVLVVGSSGLHQLSVKGIGQVQEVGFPHRGYEEVIKICAR